MDDPAETWTVYILKCADGSFYTGIAKDAARRLSQHLKGTASRYTRARLPVEPVYWEFQPSAGDALRRERAIKKLSRRQKNALIAGRPH